MRKLLAVAALASIILGAQVVATPAMATPRPGAVMAPGNAPAPLLHEAHYTPRRDHYAPYGRHYHAPPRYQARHQPHWHRHPAPPPRFDRRHPGHWR